MNYLWKNKKKNITVLTNHFIWPLIHCQHKLRLSKWKQKHTNTRWNRNNRTCQFSHCLDATYVPWDDQFCTNLITDSGPTHWTYLSVLWILFIPKSFTYEKQKLFSFWRYEDDILWSCYLNMMLLIYAWLTINRIGEIFTTNM